MRYWVGITDYDWFSFLAARPELPEVNFWQPSAGRRPVTLEAGALFLFKLHASHGGFIVGGGFFAHYSALPVRMTWDAFGVENGAASFEEMVTRIGRYRRTKIDIHADQIGCLVLVEPFFLEESEWIAPPADWAPNIVQGKGYDSGVGEGARIWSQVQLALARRMPMEPAVAEDRYGAPMLVHGLDGRVRVLPVEASLRQLAAEQQLILDGWQGESLPFTLEIDVRGNRVVVGTTGPKWANQDRLAMLPPHARLSGVHQKLIPAANIFGGLWLSSCTAGFGVRSSAGTEGISTAGHCPNTQSFGSTNLPYVTGKFSGGHDSQWHTRAGHTIVDDVRYGTSGTRDVAGRGFRSIQALGANVCYYGAVEGWDCATLESKTHTCAGSSPTSTCMRLGAPQDLVDDGDSGGPVYKVTSTAVSAYGLISGCLAAFWEDDCSGTNDLIYVATDYVEAPLGALIMTSP